MTILQFFLKKGKQPLNKPNKQQQKNLYSSHFHSTYLLTLENCTGKFSLLEPPCVGALSFVLL